MPVGSGPPELSFVELEPVSVLVADESLVVPEVLGDDEPPEPPLEPLPPVVVDVEEVPDAPVVVLTEVEPVVVVASALDVAVLLLVPADDVVPVVVVVFEPEGDESTGPGPSVPLPHATNHTLAKHNEPNLPNIVFMVIPRQPRMPEGSNLSSTPTRRGKRQPRTVCVCG